MTVKNIKSKIITLLVATTTSFGVAYADRPAFPLNAHDGHRVDDDNADGYAEVTVHADGSWNAMVHTNSTSHVWGATNKARLIIYDANKNWIWAFEIGTFGVNPKGWATDDRIDYVNAPAGHIPSNVLNNARFIAVTVESGQRPFDWDRAIEIGKGVAQAVQIIATAVSAM